jgi:3-hydroxyacyl-[acyl-carrier-protein] dehydratase
MHFNLVDRVLERSDDRIVTIKHVSSAEEYLQDHFPSFPVLPGVLMLESMVQAARTLAEPHGPTESPKVLGRVRALKYGRMVRPGSTLKVEVSRRKSNPDGTLEFEGEVQVLEPGGEAPATAASGKFTLRPLRT